ncbi:MAG: hypothetical protein RJB58_1749 [Pseudomonadota bacterium]
MARENIVRQTRKGVTFSASARARQRRQMGPAGETPHRDAGGVDIVFVAAGAQPADRRFHVLQRGGKTRLARQAVIHAGDHIALRRQIGERGRKILDRRGVAGVGAAMDKHQQRQGITARPRLIEVQRQRAKALQDLIGHIELRGYAVGKSQALWPIGLAQRRAHRGRNGQRRGRCGTDRHGCGWRGSNRRDRCRRERGRRTNRLGRGTQSGSSVWRRCAGRRGGGPALRGGTCERRDLDGDGTRHGRDGLRRRVRRRCRLPATGPNLGLGADRGARQ